MTLVSLFYFPPPPAHTTCGLLSPWRERVTAALCGNSPVSTDAIFPSENKVTLLSHSLNNSAFRVTLNLFKQKHRFPVTRSYDRCLLNLLPEGICPQPTLIRISDACSAVSGVNGACEASEAQFNQGIHCPRRRAGENVWRGRRFETSEWFLCCSLRMKNVREIVYIYFLLNNKLCCFRLWKRGSLFLPSAALTRLFPPGYSRCLVWIPAKLKSCPFSPSFPPPLQSSVQHRHTNV